jgi:hypothetical protein
MTLTTSSYVLAIYSSDEKDGDTEERNLIMYGLEPTYRLTVKIGKIPGLEIAEVGEKVELEVLIAISDTGLEADVYHNNVIVSDGLTKVRAIVKTKYTKGTPGEERKRKWRVPVFSSVKKY